MATAIHTIPDLDQKGLRRFGITTGIAVVVLFGLAIPWVFELSYPRWPWVLFGVLGACALIAPVILRPVYRGWMRFGLFMSRITTPLILGIVFFGVLLPMALIMKLIQRDPMARKLDSGQSTYRVESRKAPRENLEKPF